jgi:hypothetical protein
LKIEKNSLFLSVKGKQSEADHMSRGDHHGDTAWTCWNKELLEIVKSADDAQDASTYVVKKSPLETVAVWETMQEEEQLKHFARFCDHHQHLRKLLGWLDKCIDKLGFANAFTQEVGRAAFLQVQQWPLLALQTSRGKGASVASHLFVLSAG